MQHKSDAKIQHDVLREIEWDTRVAATAVGVAVHEGTVTLTGTVGSYPERIAAQEAAHRVAGVQDVANDLRVKPPTAHAPDDTDIAQAIRQTLEWHVQIPEERIRSDVTDGSVSLSGSVDYAYQREMAERAVRGLRGVRALANHIEIATPVVDASEVREAIEQALARRAERELRRIVVTVDDGVVTLTGTVRSYADKRLALGAARHTRGVRAVEDHLRIVTIARRGPTELPAQIAS